MPPLLLSPLRLFQHPRGLAYSIYMYVFGSNPLAYVATTWSCYPGRTIIQLRVLNIATIFVSQVTSGLCYCSCLSGSSSGTPLCTSLSRRLWHLFSLRALSLGAACCPPSLFRTLPISSFSFPRVAGALSVCHTSTAVVASSASSCSLWRGAVNDQRV